MISQARLYGNCRQTSCGLPSTSQPVKLFATPRRQTRTYGARHCHPHLHSKQLNAVHQFRTAAAAQDVDLSLLEESARKDEMLQVHMVQWYPGHIAKAERQLKEQLKMVDVVLEVRDARIPIATNHPQVPQWVGSRTRLLIMNRQDMISKADKQAWAAHFKAIGQHVYWTDGKLGDGSNKVKEALQKVSDEINIKRQGRGLQPRPVRACVIGFPNIGKSALINRLLGRKAVASAPKPGVTRMLQWVRLAGSLDLLDAPGVIPASFNDQVAAQRLAICNDIGEAAYLESMIAAAFVVRCKLLPGAPALIAKLRQRFGADPLAGTAEDFVHAVAGKLFFGDAEKAGARILKDYRTGALGSFALERPEDIAKKAAREAAVAAAAKAKEEAQSQTSRQQFAPDAR